MTDCSVDATWLRLRREAEADAHSEKLLAAMLQSRVLDHRSIGEAAAHLLAEKLDRPSMPASVLGPLFEELYKDHPILIDAMVADIASILRYDPAAQDILTPFLFYKGFHALQTHRLAHLLWGQKRFRLALFLQSRASMVFGVDTHPAAFIDHGVTFDHATGIVIGETARIGKNVLLLHDVTLGGKGYETGDRHPIIEDDVIIGAGAKILGRITIGQGAFVAAGSLVLQPVAAQTTVAGVPAKVIESGRPAVVSSCSTL